MSTSSGRLIPSQEIATHNSPSDCWIVVDNQVWDVTEFVSEHPGGPSSLYARLLSRATCSSRMANCTLLAVVILKYAGRDATKAYSDIHPPDLIKDTLTGDKFKGVLDQNALDDEWLKPPPETNPKVVLDHEKPALTSLINAHDFEVVASKTASRKTWAFYSSASNDLITRDANKSFLNRIFMRPRVLRNVREVDTRTKILGCNSSMPLFVSPAAMVKLIHSDGELGIARACETRNIIQGISNNASYSMKDITAAGPGVDYFFQLYVNRDRSKSEVLLRECSANPRIKAIFVTVDAAWPGKREADERVRVDESLSIAMVDEHPRNDKQGGGIGRVMAGFIDPGLAWADLVWVRKHTHLPLILKGVMSADDAILAMQAGMDGILLSNHGGRNLDTSPPPIITLLELHKRCPEVFDKMEIYVDSGIRRGTDILKCLCLGATAVGMGRSVLFAANYGQEGVEHLFDSKKTYIPDLCMPFVLTTLSYSHERRARGRNETYWHYIP